VTAPAQITVAQVSYDLRGAAQAAGCGVTSIKEAVDTGDLVVHYRGSKPLIRAVDLDAWVASLPTSRKSA
jgi:S-adenosylhomocysteine hydrolase